MNPTPQTLRWFGLSLGLLAALAGHLVATKLQVPTLGLAIWMAGGAVFVSYYFVARTRLSIYRGWMLVTYPIGWAVSQLLLLAIYYAVVTPIGVLRRWFGGDPLERTFNRDGGTYWTAHRVGDDVSRYLRQF
jgi:hypothetical protein